MTSSIIELLEHCQRLLDNVSGEVRDLIEERDALQEERDTLQKELEEERRDRNLL